MILFNVKKLENGTRYRYIYNGQQIESRIWSTERRHFLWPWTTANLVSKVTPLFDNKYLQNG